MTPDDPATAYARSVVEGSTPAGRLVRLACERHLRDLETGPARGLRWCPEEAEAAFAFWSICPHLKGSKWAGCGLELQPWQLFIVGSVYGWKRADGKRRFRIVWVEVPRKNGKSTLVYPAALWGLVLDGEPGAEVYSVATKRDQAKIVFDMARAAVVKTADLSELVTAYRFTLEVPDTLGKMEPLSSDADTLDGLNPSTVIADEIHKWRGRSLWDVIETGMGAREQPLLWAITTAGDEGSADVYGQEHDYTEQVLEGVVEDDSRFGYIARLDPEDDYTDPATWAKANPNLGVSVFTDALADVVKKAKASPAAVSAVKRLRFNLREQDADCWIPLGLWDRGRDPALTWEALAGFPCWGGLDLASTCDFAALALLFPLDRDGERWAPAEDATRPDVWAFKWKLWLPADGQRHTETKLRDIARPWVNEGWVEVTEGDAIDHTRISDAITGSETVHGIAQEFDVRLLAYDPYNAGPVAMKLEAEGVKVAKFTQSMSNYAGPTKAFETAIINGTIRHDGNPAARWMANNAVVIENGAGHRMPGRKRSKNKIDAVCAAIMAMGAAVGPDNGGSSRSYYDTKGVEVV